jgi:hypothetical protein
MATKIAPATSYEFKTANRFVLPGCGLLTNGMCTGDPFVSYMASYYCVPGQCFSGYPVSGGYYSYFNGTGRFYAGGPSMGAFGPTTTTTVVVPTTMGNNLPFGVPPANTAPPSGMMVNPNTPYFGGDFAFKRGGSIRLTPGPNRFSGTMRMINGPNATFKQLITKFTPFTSYGYGVLAGPTPNNPTSVGETDFTAGVNRYRMTPLLINKECITSPPGTPMTRPLCGAGNYISAMAYYLHLVGGPWTTGMASAYQPNYKYHTKRTFTGYDNKSPAVTPMNKIGADYATRVVSLVRPRLTHQYLRDALDPDNPIQTFSAARMWKLNVFFLPEPGGIALLVTGVAGLAGLAVLTRRRRR